MGYMNCGFDNSELSVLNFPVLIFVCGYMSMSCSQETHAEVFGIKEHNVCNYSQMVQKNMCVYMHAPNTHGRGWGSKWGEIFRLCLLVDLAPQLD